MSVLHTAYIALGSNLGDREGNLRQALKRLGKVVRVSSFLENAAVGGPVGSPAFVNAAAKVETGLTPGELMRRLLEIEQEMGRVRREKWGPRVIDLDLLMYENRVIAEEGLVVPHPLMGERDFVLVPLAEIAAEVVHPVVGKTIGQMLRGLKGVE